MLESLLLAVTYSAVGVGILLAGFYALDLVTPGRLGKHVSDGSMNSALVVSAGFIGLAGVIFTAIWRNGGDASDALSYTIAFGLLGALMQAVGFLIVEWLTPGDLRQAVCNIGRITPMGVAAAAIQLSVAAIVAASIA